MVSQQQMLQTVRVTSWERRMEPCEMLLGLLQMTTYCSPHKLGSIHPPVCQNQTMPCMARLYSTPSLLPNDSPESSSR
ncbi:unnamed protein product [Linum tenue]|uniref:Uncharacterized protein n=1 Tax=Linum tenue TaxID=586396 RepID=A0AAV0JPT1_9ROSI|nr:unnamed protein product [Linum tenue]